MVLKSGVIVWAQVCLSCFRFLPLNPPAPFHRESCITGGRVNVDQVEDMMCTVHRQFPDPSLRVLLCALNRSLLPVADG